MTKECYWCGRGPAFEHLNRLICEKCFVRLMERRVQKGLGRVLEKGDKVLVVGDLAEYFLRKIVKNLPLKIVKVKKMPGKINNKIVVEETMDDVVSDFLAGFFGENFDLVKDKKTIKILKVLTDEEAVKSAEIKGIKFKVNEKNKKIKEFLKKLSRKHPEIRYNLLKNVEEMEKVL